MLPSARRHHSSASRRRPAASRRRRGVVVLLAIALGGCDRGATDATVRTDGIASLSPAMTTIIRDLGAESRLVGRTPWCRGIDDRPVVGALDGADAEMLLRLRPAVVVVQPPATGIDPVVLDLQGRLGFTLIARRLDGARDVAAVVAALRDAGVGDPARAEARLAAVEAVLSAASAPRSADAPRVLILHSIDPFSTAGAETYLDEIVRAAGGINAVALAGWRTLGAEEVVGLAPDVVLLVTGGLADPEVVATLPWAASPRIVVLDSAEAVEPSSRMPEVVDAVRGLLELDGDPS